MSDIYTPLSRDESDRLVDMGLTGAPRLRDLIQVLDEHDDLEIDMSYALAKISAYRTQRRRVFMVFQPYEGVDDVYFETLEEAEQHARILDFVESAEDLLRGLDDHETFIVWCRANHRAWEMKRG